MKNLPIIIGLFLATVSILMGQIPRAVAQFSGMTVLGDHMGYLWGALVVAWLYNENWRKSFTASFLCMLVSYAAYYSALIALYQLNFIPLALSPLHYLRSFVFWTILAGIVCILASTAVWVVRHTESKVLKHGIFLTSFLVMIGAMFWSNRFFIIGWNGIRTITPIDYIPVWRFMGHLFEIVFAFIVTIVIWGLAFRSVVKQNNNHTK